MAVSVISRIVLLVVLFALSPASTAIAQGRLLPRVVSINVCTDQLVMLVADSEQIVGLSSLSRDEAGSVLHDVAQDYPQVDPVAEELLPLAPDFVVTGPYTSRHSLGLLEELGVRVETFPVANSIDEMLANVDRLGNLLDRSERAGQIISDSRRRLADIRVRVSRLNADRPRAAVYDTNGYTVGNNTVRGQILALSGWNNVAVELGIDSYGVLGLEQLIALQPQALIESPYSEGTYSRGQQLTRHPAIGASGLDPLIIRVPSNQTLCAGPWTIDVIEMLMKARAEMQPGLRAG